MMISTFYVLLFSALLQVFAGCSKQSDPTTSIPDPVDPVVQPTTLVSLPAEWKKTTALMTGFPASIEVYRNTTSFSGKAMNAYCVVFDPKNTGLEFKPVLAPANKKPSALFAEESGTVYACINGGFFGTNVSYSLVQYNSTISAVNIKSLNRPYNGISTAYYPTRGAFGIDANGKPEVTWIYHTGSDNNIVYSYPSPSPNELNTAPKPQPSSYFPSGGEVWNTRSAIGGSPVLIKNDVINITDKEELIDINNTTSRARSAIGSTADGKVVLLAVEGNHPSGGAGLNLQELATLMKNMGCINAMNLDGGGSTAMVINGQQTVKPSDAGGERPVMSVLLVKKK